MSSDSESVQPSITGFWDVVAPHYDDRPGNTPPFESEAYRRWVGLFGRLLPSSPAEVLDLGTGTGFSALVCASLGHNVTGIDLAAGMLAVARERAAERGLDVRFEEGDAVAPPFEAATFDVITSRNLLWTLREAEEALANWRRLLRPGGRVLAFDSIRPRPQPAADVDPEDLFGRHYGPTVQAAIPFLHVRDEGPVSEAFRAAGFTEVRIEVLPQDYAEDDDADVRPYGVIGFRSSSS